MIHVLEWEYVHWVMQCLIHIRLVDAFPLSNKYGPVIDALSLSNKYGPVIDGFSLSNKYGPVSKGLVFGVATAVIWPPTRWSIKKHWKLADSLQWYLQYKYSLTALLYPGGNFWKEGLFPIIAGLLSF